MGNIQWLTAVSLCWLQMFSCNKLIDFLVSHGNYELYNQTTGIKRSKDGILNSDPFMEASHFWPFDSSLNILTTDLVTGHRAVMLHGATIEHSKNSKYLSTEKKGAYVICGDFRETCFSDLQQCILGGMTVSFWLVLHSKYYNPDEDQYIISSGAQSLNSTGFAFVNFHGTFAAVWNHGTREWEMRIPRDEIPLNKRVNIAFVWDARNDSLTFYLNGKEKKSINGEKTNRPKINYTFLTISRPNNAHAENYMMPLKMSYFGLWDRPLNADQIKMIYENVKEVLNEKSSKR